MNPQPVFAWEFIDLSRPHQTITSPGQPLQVTQDTMIEYDAYELPTPGPSKHLQALGPT